MSFLFQLNPLKRALICVLMVLLSTQLFADAPLPSWQDSSSKKAIISYVEAVTTPGSADFVPKSERIAVFDNDGTLWSEQPAYFQLSFAIDRIKILASKHPEWKKQQPFKAVLENDMNALTQSGEKGLLQLIMASHANMTTDEFNRIVSEWLKSETHPRFKRPYTELVYQPMLEVLHYMRQHGFKTYIVSGGGIEFVRVFSEQVYGIPPEQVVGSSIKTEFSIQDGKPMLLRLPEIDFIDDKAGKPVGINRHIGRRPIAAFGNSDGDLQMLQWSATSKAKSLQVLVHHTDNKREWAYDKDSHIGKLDKAMVEAKKHKWIVVDMRDDWKTIYP